MSTGTDAVKLEICKQFNDPDIHEEMGIAFEETNIWFDAENDHLKVRIQYEFDNDYDGSQGNVDLTQLKKELKQSTKSPKTITVTKEGNHH